MGSNPPRREISICEWASHSFSLFSNNTRPICVCCADNLPMICPHFVHKLSTSTECMLACDAPAATHSGADPLTAHFPSRDLFHRPYNTSITRISLDCITLIGDTYLTTSTCCLLTHCVGHTYFHHHRPKRTKSLNTVALARIESVSHIYQNKKTQENYIDHYNMMTRLFSPSMILCRAASYTMMISASRVASSTDSVHNRDKVTLSYTL